MVTLLECTAKYEPYFPLQWVAVSLSHRSSARAVRNGLVSGWVVGYVLVKGINYYLLTEIQGHKGTGTKVSALIEGVSFIEGVECSFLRECPLLREWSVLY
jgi:hypothetical protein